MWAKTTTTAVAAIAVFYLAVSFEATTAAAAFLSAATRNTRSVKNTKSVGFVWTPPARKDKHHGSPYSFHEENKKKHIGLPSSSSSTTILLLASSSTSSSSSTLMDHLRRHEQTTANSLIEIGPVVGCGSYGTVHRVAFCTTTTTNDDGHDDDNNESSSSSKKKASSFSFIGKRAWNVNDLVDLLGDDTVPQELRDKSSRCQYYWNVEAHCFAKLKKKQVSKSYINNNKDDDIQFIQDLVLQKQHVPPFRGIFKDNVNGNEWMVFDLIPGTDLMEAKNEDMDDISLIVQPPAAPTLQDIMNLDRNNDHHLRDDDAQGHHLLFLSQALGLSSDNHDDDSIDNDSSSSFLTKTLDIVIEQVLEILTAIHAQNIVHRDIKPSNILVSSSLSSSDNKQQQQQLFLMDFGSAADLDGGPGNPFAKKIGLEDQQRVAISPIYAAPELFINVDAIGGGQYVKDVACTFDCFSAGLLFCQLLFQYLDELTDTGFRQQLESAAQWNLNTWLQAELASKFRPRNSLENALQVLADRPGLWTLLQDLLQPDPRDRCTSKQALKRWKEIRQQAQRTTTNDDNYVDGAYLQEVLQSMDICITPEDEISTTTTTNVNTVSSVVVSTTTTTISTRTSSTTTIATSRTDTDPLLVLNSRPIQYVATFRRKQSLGLLLAEAFDMDQKASPDILNEITNESHRMYWQHVIVPNARPGEVYIYGIVPLAQADEMEIFEIGDRLQGVGELPLGDGGFEKVISLLQDQPASATYVTLHFDRKTTSLASAAARAATGAVVTNNNHNETDGQSLLSPLVPSLAGPVQCRDQGAWSSRGRRKSQEDRFILHEVHGTNDQSILIAGVLDGHLGTAASTMVQEELPIVFTEHLLKSRSDSTNTNSVMISTGSLLKRAWEQVCDAYQTKCMSNDECVAVYDAREGLLDANTGSSDAAAGTTASLMALDKQTGVLTMLNCGDSRSLIFDGDGKLIFQTVDHKPDLAEELERLSEGQKQGLSYSLPECRFSRWYLPVGEYEYAVSRSLEGQFATARGIVYNADVTDIQVTGIVVAVSATDGLFEVMDTAQVGQIVHQLRTTRKMTASDAAKTLCSMAMERGSSDNISVVILYLDA